LGGGDGRGRQQEQGQESHASFIIPGRRLTFGCRRIVAGIGRVIPAERRMARPSVPVPGLEVEHDVDTQHE